MSETVSGKSVSSKMKRSVRWHGRIPASVLLDKELSSEAVRVYGLLALSVYQGTVAYVGMREIGRIIGKSAATVKRRIDELAAREHIVPRPGKNGQRSHYHLTSPVFGQKQRAGVTEVVSAPSGGQRYASIGKEVA